jgi:hypothetical protein
MCQARAMGVASRLRKERGTKPKVHLVENDDHELLRKFLLALGLTDKDPSYLNTLSGLTHSDIQLLEAVPPFRLFKVVQNTNIRKRKLRLVYEGYGPSKNILESDTAYVLQCHPGEVFVWYGKTAATEARAIANAVSRRIALQYHQEAHQNGVGGVWISVLRLFEGSEYAVWKEKFIDYEGSLPISMRMAEKKGNIVRNVIQQPIDILKMVAFTPYVDTSCVDNGTNGKIKLFRVKDFQREEVEEKNIGQFFRGESYIVLYTYRPPNSGVDKCISYFWQGFESSITEKGTSALMTIELTEKAGIDVTHIRVVEGRGNRGGIIFNFFFMLKHFVVSRTKTLLLDV